MLFPQIIEFCKNEVGSGQQGVQGKRFDNNLLDVFLLDAIHMFGNDVAIDDEIFQKLGMSEGADDILDNLKF